MSDSKKLFIKTFGCQMNVYDSERMAESLGAKGYEQTTDASEADMILLNTCHIREKAAEKMYSDLGRLRPLKDAKPDLKIGVAGCVAQAEGAEIMRRQPMVDLVVGPQTYHRQVLRVLRCALYSRGRGVASCRPYLGRGARIGRAWRARDHTFGPERECLSRGASRRGLFASKVNLGVG